MCHVDGDGTVGAALLQWDGVVGKLSFQLSTYQQENSLSDTVTLCAACKGKEGLGWEGREGNGT